MTSEDSPPADDFYARTIERVQRIMIVISVAALVTAQIYFGWRVSLGVALGSIISYVNFHWLKTGVAGLADLAANSATPISSRGTVMRFLVRYFLMAVLGLCYTYCFAREPVRFLCRLAGNGGRIALRGRL